MFIGVYKPVKTPPRTSAAASVPKLRKLESNPKLEFGAAAVCSALQPCVWLWSAALVDALVGSVPVKTC